MKKKNLVFIMVLFFIITATTTVNAKYITGAWEYSSSCQFGTESTCKSTSCYSNQTSASCAGGTIVKYKVNDSEEKYFHVLHDDGATLTLQQQDYAGYSAWYTTGAVTSGPLSVLTALDSYTAGWTNVNMTSYTFGESPYLTDCPSYSCSGSSYRITRQGKARIITIQEAMALGCSNGEGNTCPGFLRSSKDTEHYWTANTWNAQGMVYLISKKSSGYDYILGNAGDSSKFKPVIVVNKESIADSTIPDDSDNSTGSNDTDNTIEDNGSSSNGDKTIQNSNKPQVVNVEDTLKISYIGYVIGLIILTLGIAVVIQSVIKDKKEKIKTE